MHRMYSKKPLLILLATILVSGCSTRPEAQIKRAQDEMEQAKSEYAALFAPDEWKTAEEAWNSAQDMLAQKKYREAAALLLKAQTTFSRAHEIAKGRREVAIKEITGLQKTIELRNQKLKEDIEANSGKLSAVNRKTLEEACKEFDDSIVKIPAQLERGEYNEAKYLAGKTLRQVWESERDLRNYLGTK